MEEDGTQAEERISWPRNILAVVSGAGVLFCKIKYVQVIYWVSGPAGVIEWVSRDSKSCPGHGDLNSSEDFFRQQHDFWCPVLENSRLGKKTPSSQAKPDDVNPQGERRELCL